MSTFDSLDETFDITPTEVVEKPVKAKPVPVTNKGEDREKDTSVVRREDSKGSVRDADREKDFAFQRATLYNLVDKMQESLDGALETAQESGHPRAWEVALNGAKAASEVVEKLSSLHSAAAKQEQQSAQPTAQMQGGTQNNIFMTGSTSELMLALKEMQKDTDNQ